MSYNCVIKWRNTGCRLMVRAVVGCRTLLEVAVLAASVPPRPRANVRWTLTRWKLDTSKQGPRIPESWLILTSACPSEAHSYSRSTLSGLKLRKRTVRGSQGGDVLTSVRVRRQLANPWRYASALEHTEPGSFLTTSLTTPFLALLLDQLPWRACFGTQKCFDAHGISKHRERPNGTQKPQPEKVLSSLLLILLVLSLSLSVLLLLLLVVVVVVVIMYRYIYTRVYVCIHVLYIYEDSRERAPTQRSCRQSRCGHWVALLV